MKKEDFFSLTLIEDIKRQLGENTKSLELYGTASNLPLIALFDTPVNDIQTALKVLEQNLEREHIAIRRLIRKSGEDTLPAQIFVSELDSQAILAVSEDCLYLLDRRIYAAAKGGRNWIENIKKVVNGKVVASYE